MNLKFLSCLFIAYLTIQNAFACDSDKITQLIYKIDPIKYGIICNAEGTVGPEGFSVLNDKVAISNVREILIIEKNGKLYKKIKLNKIFGHFDIDSKGNGFFSIDGEIYEIKEFNAILGKYKKSLGRGAGVGYFRLDLVNSNLRVIYDPPAYIAHTINGNFNNMNIDYAKNLMGKKIFDNLSDYVGKYENLHIFCDYDYDSSEIWTIKIEADYEEDGKIKSLVIYNKSGDYYGMPIRWSHAFRLDEKKGCFYMML